MAAPEKQPQTPKAVVASIVGGVFGIYSGANVLIPAIGGGIAWYVGKKLVPPRNPTYLAAISLLFGHTLWLFAGMALLNQWGLNVLDLVVFGVGALWLWLRPGLAPVLVITVFELIALAINLVAIWPEPFASATHKALVVHIGLRIAVLYYLYSAFIQTRHRTAGDA